MSDKTSVFSIKDINTQEIHEIINYVSDALDERGYDSTNQIVGYLISGDPGYISSYKNARGKIQEIDRENIIEVFLRNFKGI